MIRHPSTKGIHNSGNPVGSGDPDRWAARIAGSLSGRDEDRGKKRSRQTNAVIIAQSVEQAIREGLAWSTKVRARMVVGLTSSSIMME